MKKKTMAVGVAIVLMMSGMGVSYAYWEDTLTVQTSITTGKLKGSLKPGISCYGLESNKQINLQVENTGDVAWVLDTEKDISLRGKFDGVLKDDVIFENYDMQVAIDGQMTNDTVLLVPIGSTLQISIDFEIELTQKLGSFFKEDFEGLQAMQVEANMILRNVYGAEEGWCDSIDEMTEISAAECLEMMMTKPQVIMPLGDTQALGNTLEGELTSANISASTEVVTPTAQDSASQVATPAE